MNIHEYQAKAILRKFGVPVPDGHVCYNGASAREWAKRASIQECLLEHPRVPSTRKRLRVAIKLFSKTASISLPRIQADAFLHMSWYT
jgi:hypothetical protein